MADHDPAQRVARLTDRKCPDCGTPTTVYRGSVHKFRCLACVADVVGLAYRPADALPRAVPPGCDARGREILPMGRHRSILTMSKETSR
ncbi:hypothetical protein ACFVH4_13775 [Nocardia ignorata]|uniref:hypothetical protein n=1 Tax=Nocardia ignorata TaxID=145285 RepID=UPI0036345C76